MRKLKFTKPQYMSVMSNQSFSMNSMKKAGTNSGEGVLPGSSPTEQDSRFVLVLLRKEIGESTGLKKLIEL